MKLISSSAAKIVILIFIYVIAAYLGLTFDAVNKFATFVWPPTGIALAALLIFGYRLWPGIALGAFLINFITGASFFAAAGIALGNTLEAIVGTYLLRRVKFRNSIDRLQDVLGFIGMAVIASTIVSATIGTSSLLISGVILLSAYGQTWLAWWIGDMLGALIVTPLLLKLFEEQFHHEIIGHEKAVLKGKNIEMVALAVVTLIVSLMIFGNLFGPNVKPTSLLYIAFVPLIWAALRFGQRGAVLTIFAMSILSIWGTVYGFGPFVRGRVSESLLYLQLFMGTIAATTMIMAAIAGERTKIERELRRREQQLEALFANIGDGLVVTDQDGDVIMLNPSAQRMLGKSLREVVGKPLPEAVPMEDEKGNPIAIEKRPMYEALKTGRKISMSGSYVRGDKTKLPIATTVTPFVLGEKIIGTIEVFRDVTKEREVDRAKSELISLTSHQLRTPLAIIKWSAETLLKATKRFTENQKQNLQDIYESNHRMIETVDTLLDVSRVELGTFTMKRQSVAIRDVVKSLLKELAPPMRKKKLNIEEHYDPKDPRFNTDQKLTEIIFQNLLSNAVKYNVPGGKVVISVSVSEKQGMKIEISDTGYGIPHDARSKIFTKLFRAENAQQREPDGNGLGLYLVKSIVEEAEGKIWFVSEENKGTTFYVIIPKK